MQAVFRACNTARLRDGVSGRMLIQLVEIRRSYMPHLKCTASLLVGSNRPITMSSFSSALAFCFPCLRLVGVAVVVLSFRRQAGHHEGNAAHVRGHLQREACRIGGTPLCGGSRRFAWRGRGKCFLLVRFRQYCFCPAAYVCSTSRSMLAHSPGLKVSGTSNLPS